MTTELLKHHSLSKLLTISLNALLNLTNFLQQKSRNLYTDMPTILRKTNSLKEQHTEKLIHQKHSSPENQFHRKIHQKNQFTESTSLPKTTRVPISTGSWK